MLTSRLWVLAALVALSVACSFDAQSRKSATVTRGPCPRGSLRDRSPAASGGLAPLASSVVEPSASPKGAAMRAYRDPVTGRLGPPPAAPAGAPAAAMAPPLGSTGLVEVPTPYGGTLVDLQGRFASHSVATVHPDGARATCVDGAP
jgi:hypothetical protein